MAKAMAPTNKIQSFKFLRDLFERTGIHPYQSNQNGSYNSRNLFILVFLLTCLMGSIVFLLIGAHSIAEVVDSYYVSVTAFLLFFLWPFFIYNSVDLFALMDQMDEFQQKSESNHEKYVLKNFNLK